MKKEQHLVIVESPTKAKTLAKFLPKEYKISSSMGHIISFTCLEANSEMQLKISLT